MVRARTSESGQDALALEFALGVIQARVHAVRKGQFPPRAPCERCEPERRRIESVRTLGVRVAIDEQGVWAFDRGTGRLTAPKGGDEGLHVVGIVSHANGPTETWICAAGFEVDHPHEPLGVLVIG